MGFNVHYNQCWGTCESTSYMVDFSDENGKGSFAITINEDGYKTWRRHVGVIPEDETVCGAIAVLLCRLSKQENTPKTSSAIPVSDKDMPVHRSKRCLCCGGTTMEDNTLITKSVEDIMTSDGYNLYAKICLECGYVSLFHRISD